MIFECKRIEISDEELGCTITFCDSVYEEFDENKKIEDLVNSHEKYLLIQRTYGEDEFDRDYHYFETSEGEIGGEMKEFKIELSRNKFTLKLPSNSFEIEIKPSEQEFIKLKKNLNIMTLIQGELKIKE
jgi:hypothetical protein